MLPSHFGLFARVHPRVRGNRLLTIREGVPWVLATLTGDTHLSPKTQAAFFSFGTQSLKHLRLECSWPGGHRTLQCAAAITVGHVINGACSLLNRSRNPLAQTKEAR